MIRTNIAYYISNVFNTYSRITQYVLGLSCDICVNYVSLLRHSMLCNKWHFLTVTLQMRKKQFEITVFKVIKLLSLYFGGDIFILMHHLYPPLENRRWEKVDRGDEIIKYQLCLD